MGIFPHKMGCLSANGGPRPRWVFLLDQPVRVMGMEALDAAWRGCAAHPCSTNIRYMLGDDWKSSHRSLQDISPWRRRA